MCLLLSRGLSVVTARPTGAAKERFPSFLRPQERAAGAPPSDKPGGLNRSVQHLLAVYLPASENPKFFWDVDLSAAPPRFEPCHVHQYCFLGFRGY
jgi:hypothetical protein